MRIPLVWRPARAAAVTPAAVTDPVGQVDLAPTFCAIAGIGAPEWMQGTPLPVGDGTGRERVITEWDSQFSDIDMHLRSIHRDGWTCTTYEPGGVYDGTEGELYDLTDDPHLFHNRWDDAGSRSLRDDLVADLTAHLPPVRADRLAVEAPA
jgi:arylsulfatase A-like enzyme